MHVFEACKVDMHPGSPVTLAHSHPGLQYPYKMQQSSCQNSGLCCNSFLKRLLPLQNRRACLPRQPLDKSRGEMLRISYCTLEKSLWFKFWTPQEEVTRMFSQGSGDVSLVDFWT